MSGSTLMVTVVGWAATTPREVVGDGVPFTSFRVASTPRHFDSRQGTWVDGRTQWVTVKAFREVAFNVAASVHKGDPVLVHGRLQTEEWQSESGQRTTVVVEAVALGHDLTRGTGRFARTINVSGQGGLEGAAVGAGPGAPALRDGLVGEDPDGVPSNGVEDVDPWAVPLEAERQEADAVTP